VNRLQKLIEKGSGGPARIAYTFGADRLPPAQADRKWELVGDFNPAEELLENGSLKALFQIAIAEGWTPIDDRSAPLWRALDAR
jgi:hypothetical protein